VAGDFEINDTRIDARVHLFALRGEVDMSTAPVLDQALQGAIDAGEHVLVIDFGETLFLDSTALFTLLRAQRRLNALGGELVFAAVPPTVGRVLAVTGMDQHFAIHATRDEALAAVA
jgi:anti-anti-sigma factor